jgi:glutaredoxin
MIYFKTAIILFLLSLPFPTMAISDCHEIVIYSKASCPYCQDAYRYFAEVKKQLPNLTVHKRDIVASNEALAEFREKISEWSIQYPSVPLINVCGNIFIGFDDAIETEIDEIIGRPAVDNPKSHEKKAVKTKPENSISLPLFGDISLNDIGLPLFTIVVGLVDGFNPCAMWVLLFLLSLLVNLKNRKRMAIVAGTFVLISGIVYFALMAAWLNVFLIIGISRWLQIGLGCVALLVSGINIKDFFYFQKGVSLHIPDSAKPELFKRMRAIVTIERLPVALLGITILAIAVNLLELVCTAGLPAIYTQILTNQQLEYSEYLAYLGLYNLAYIFDDGILVAIAVITLSKHKLQASHARKLKLVSGLVIGGLGILLLAQPSWLF